MKQNILRRTALLAILMTSTSARLFMVQLGQNILSDSLSVVYLLKSRTCLKILPATLKTKEIWLLELVLRMYKTILLSQNMGEAEWLVKWHLRAIIPRLCLIKNSSIHHSMISYDDVNSNG